MELILAKRTKVEIEWHFGPPYEDGELVSVPAIEEVCVLENYITYSNEIALTPTLNDNDWEMQMSVDMFRNLKIIHGDWIYARNSEFGGIVEDIERIDDVIKISGANFRGYLAKHIITPSKNDKEAGKFGDYVELKMEANKLLWAIWGMDHTTGSAGDRYDDFNVIGLIKDTKKIIKDKWRFVNYLSAMQKSLSSHGMRIQTKHVYIDYEKINASDFRVPDFWKGERTHVFTLSAEPVKDYSGDDLFSQDYDLRISSGNFTKNARKFLWCLGAGEMEKRDVVVLKDGTPIEIGELDTMGSLWDSELFEYPNAENHEELIKAGTKHYQENCLGKKYVELSVNDSKIEFFLGDIIGGEDFITGIEAKAEIISKELTISNGIETILYKIGGK